VQSAGKHRFARIGWRGHGNGVSYELRALAARDEVAARAADAIGSVLVPLPQGFGLVPVTAELLDDLSDDAGRAYPDAFWFLTAGLAERAATVSAAGAIAYLEADVFGGAGTQAMVVWRAGQVVLGPVRTAFRAGADHRDDAFNRALRELGVAASAAGDEFAALGLGGRRHTDGWLTADDAATS
jgi:hypothetical protein